MHNSFHGRSIGRTVRAEQIIEARTFAEAIQGNPWPGAKSGILDSTRRGAELEWLAHFSTRHEHELRRVRSVDSRERRREELLEFATTTSTRCEEEYRKVGLRNRYGIESPERCTPLHRDQASLNEADWDASKHPRRGAAPNAGWFASSGDTSGGNSRARNTSTRQPTTDLKSPLERRAYNNIRSRSGDNWSGDHFLDVMRAVAPGWLPFIKQRVTLTQTSDGSKEAATTVREGEHGPAVDGRADPSDPSFGPTTIHFEIPREWNDAQVAQYVLGQLAENDLAHRIAATWARDSKTPELMSHLQWERFKSGMKTVAALAGTYYKALAGLAPGSGAVVAAWDIEHGDYFGAALGAAFMLPLGEIGKAGVELSGTVAIKVGDKLIATLPVKVIQRVQKLLPDQLALLQKRLLTAQTEGEAARIAEDFLETQFHAHHPLPKFLAGDINQIRANIPAKVHEEFHAVLRAELRNAGFSIPIGGRTGSGKVWRQHFEKFPGSQRKAFDAVLKASRKIDAKHGTEVTSAVWQNVMEKNATFFK